MLLKNNPSSTPRAAASLSLRFDRSRTFGVDAAFGGEELQELLQRVLGAKLHDNSTTTATSSSSSERPTAAAERKEESRAVVPSARGGNDDVDDNEEDQPPPPPGTHSVSKRSSPSLPANIEVKFVTLKNQKEFLFHRAHHSFLHLLDKHIVPSHDKYFVHYDIFRVDRAKRSSPTPLSFPGVRYMTLKQFVETHGYPNDLLPVLYHCGDSPDFPNVDLDKDVCIQFYHGKNPQEFDRGKQPFCMLKPYHRDATKTMVLDEVVLVCADLSMPLIFYDGPSHRHRRVVMQNSGLHPPTQYGPVHYKTLHWDSFIYDRLANGVRKLGATMLTQALFGSSFPMDLPSSAEDREAYSTMMNALVSNIVTQMTHPTSVLQIVIRGETPNDYEKLYGICFGEKDDEKELFILDAWARAQRQFPMRKIKKKERMFLLMHSHIPLEHMSYPHYLAKYEGIPDAVVLLRELMQRGELVTVDGIVIATEAQLRKALFAKFVEQRTSENRRWESFIVSAVNWKEPEEDGFVDYVH